MVCLFFIKRPSFFWDFFEFPQQFFSFLDQFSVLAARFLAKNQPNPRICK
jgi:hypothetical protein